MRADVHTPVFIGPHLPLETTSFPTLVGLGEALLGEPMLEPPKREEGRSQVEGSWALSRLGPLPGKWDSKVYSLDEKFPFWQG